MSGIDIGFLAIAALALYAAFSKTPVYSGLGFGNDAADRLRGSQERFVRIICGVVGILMLVVFVTRWLSGTWVVLRVPQ